MKTLAEIKAERLGKKVEPAPVRPVAVVVTKEQVAKKMKVDVSQVVEVRKAGRPKKDDAMSPYERLKKHRARMRIKRSDPE